MTENRTTTDPATLEVEVDTETMPSDAATTDALESVTTTESVVTDDAPDPVAELAEDAAEEVAVGEAAPAGNATLDEPADAEDATSHLNATSASATDASASTTDASTTDASGEDASAADTTDASTTDVSAVDDASDADTSDTTTGNASDADTSEGADLSGAEVSGGSEGAPFGEEEGVLSGVEVVVDDATMRRALEAILMVTDEPLPVLTLARTVGRPTGDVSAALNELAGEYTEQGRGFDLREVGGGWRYYTRADAAQYVERFVLDGQQSRLTQAALETLAVVAYKQPVSRARVSAIRGVNVDGVMRTLISRGLVEEAGADTESQATLYRTTSYFLERMGMQSLDDLPELAPYLPDMDDMEEELAAQNAPAPTESEAVSEEESDVVPAGQAETVVRADEAVSAEYGGSAAARGEAVEVDGDEVAVVQESEAVSSDEGEAVAVEPVAEGEGRDDELEPAEELEAGGDEIETDADPAEIPAGEEDADGNDDGDESADFDAAVGDLDDDDEDEDDDLAIDVVEDLEAADGDIDEGDESVDERLEAAEDLELAGVPDESDDEPVAGGSQYGTEANERNE